MKPELQYAFLLFSLLSLYTLSGCSLCFAQKDKYGTHQVTINYPDSTIKTYILNQKLRIKPKGNIEYYWVYNQKLYKNRGDYTYYLIHGPYLVFDVKGQMITKGEFKLGVKDGKWKSWFSNGELKEEIDWVAGRRQGISLIYNETGRLQSKLSYRDNKLDGKCEYYNNGETVIRKYKNGKEVEIKSFLDYFNSIKADRDTIPD